MLPRRKSPWTTVSGRAVGHGFCKLGRDVVDLRELARLVDVPKLCEAPHLPLVVAPRTRERRKPGTGDIGGVDLDERIDQVVAKPTAGRLALEPGRQLVRRNVAVDVLHDVERHAEDALVVADGDDRGKSNEPRIAQRQLQPRLTYDVVRRGRQRRTRRPAKDEATLVALEQEGEVRAAAFADAPRPHVARAEPVLVEERPHAVEHEQGRLLEA